MPRKLTIISTCTNQKRGAAPENLHMAGFGGGFPREVAKEWVQRLSEAPVSTPSRELYLGSHWIESLACEQSAQDQELSTSFWVLSAGYGLVSGDEALSPYASSFAPGTDSIHNLAWPEDWSPRQRSHEWWQLMHRYRKRKGLGRFKGLSKTREPVLLILSREYYHAVESELIDLISAGVNLSIVSAGMYRNISSASPVVRPYILPFSDSFKQVDEYLNKTNVSLNARLANWLVKNHVEELEAGVEVLVPMLEAIHKDLPKMVRKDVNRMSDEEVLEFIGKNYSADLNSATRLLRRLRDVENLSCEQKRFGALFRQYQQSLQTDLFDHE